MGRKERLHLRLVFLELERAGGIDEQPARLYDLRGGPQDVTLNQRCHRQVAHAQAPASVGMSAEGAGAGARRIHQHRIHRGDGRLPGVERHRRHVWNVEAVLGVEEPREPRCRQVGAYHERGRARQLDALASGGAAEIGHGCPSGNGGVARDQRCRGILHEAAALREGGELLQVDRSREADRVVGQRCVGDRGARGLEHRLQLFAYQSPRAQDHRRLAVICLEQRARLFGAPSGHPPRDEPARVRELRRQRVNRVGREVRPKGRALTVEPAQDGVDELARPQAMALLGQLHRLGDRGVGRNASHLQQLVGAQPDQVGQVAVETRQPAAHARHQGVVDPAAAAQHSIDEFLRPAPVPAVENRPAAVEGGPQQDPRPEVCADVRRHPARVRDRGADGDRAVAAVGHGWGGGHEVYV